MTDLSVFEGQLKQQIGTYDYGSDLLAAIILRSAGAFYIRGVNNFEGANLLWVSNHNTDADLTPTIDLSDPTTPDDLQVVDLADAWASDYGIASQSLLGQRQAGDTYSHTANALIEWRSVSNEVIAFRRQDDANLWNVAVGANGSLTLNEVISGTATARGTAGAGTVATGHRCVIVAVGQTIQLFSGVDGAEELRITYASAANYSSLTSGKVVSGSPSDLTAWPYEISGDALTALHNIYDPPTATETPGTPDPSSTPGTAEPSSTPTTPVPTSTPTLTPTVVPTATGTPRYLQEIPLSTGGTLLIEKRVNFGDVAVVGSVLVLATITLVAKMVEIPKRWFR